MGVVYINIDYNYIYIYVACLSGHTVKLVPKKAKCAGPILKLSWNSHCLAWTQPPLGTYPR